ncbi:MAG: NAD(P)-dependent oxidoreductase [Alphaproteobacteria bacterium]
MKILNLEPKDYSADARAILDKIGVVDNGPLSRATLNKNIDKYEVLIVRLGHKIDKEILNQAKKLKVIVTATTGLNHIDEAEVKNRGIEILSLKGEREFLDSIHATAEHTFALLLSLIRSIPASFCNVHDGKWDRDAFKGTELNGRTLGIIGYGRIGSKVAKYAEAFGMKILANDILDIPGVNMTDLDTLLQKSDVVSIHVPYSDRTHEMIGELQFSKMKNGGIFINTARGEIVDEDALLEALKSGRLSGAAIDVLQGENSGKKSWAKKNKLVAYARKNSNLLITPHTGGATYDSMAKTEIFMAEKLLKWKNG